MSEPIDRGARLEPPGPPIGLVLDCVDPDDWFIVMQDPEGNEFCLV